MYEILRCALYQPGEGFIPNVLERYVLNAYTAILLFVCFLFCFLYVNIYVNVNMLIRNSRGKKT